ncbi:sugar phosphate isomerase/epimerase [Novosphingobium sp. PS1R-30]|uniref:Sugar phosphate isomerase/epimerase n=1 Tax=Novosphingobium anseongense TaxID=3133436 RepID=A0ABU8S0H1_9SPHN
MPPDEKNQARASSADQRAGRLDTSEMSGAVSRRSLLMYTALLAAPALARPGEAPTIRFGVQLYPLQAPFASDMPGLFSTLARAGFRTVEFAGFAPHSPSAIRSALSQAGLQAFGAHCLPLTLSDEEAARQMDACAAIGAWRVTTALPSVMPTKDRPKPPLSAVFSGMSGDDLRWSAERMNHFAHMASARGLIYGYHSHNVDFALVEGRTILDWLMRLTEPGAVALQLDLGNAVLAGADPIALLGRYRGRVRSVHVKDWIAGFTPSLGLRFPAPAPLGAGAIDWDAIMRALSQFHVADIIVEQEAQSGTDSLAAQIQAVDYLRGMVRKNPI